jgi:predicted DCC family thiol-disulfide oxidoreductase YuxK
VSPVWNGPVVLFDGTCGLCDRAVDFLIRHDHRRRLRFAALQSEVGARLAAEAGIRRDEDTLILVEDGRSYIRSAAVLRAAGHLGAPWRFAAWLRVVPRAARDAAYRLVARNRHRWFGRRATCRVPTAADRERFLE